jgi:hypothetical protein
MKIFKRIEKFTLAYPAAMVGMLATGAFIAAVEHSLVPAIVQALCACALACTIKRVPAEKT